MRRVAAALSAGFTAALLLAGKAGPAQAPAPAEAQFQDVRLTHILGMSVEDPNAQVIGTVKDLVLDVTAAKTAYVIISSGGFLGWGARDRAAPAREVSAATITRGTLSCSLSRAAWEKAPAYTSEKSALAHPLGPASGRPGTPPTARLEWARDLLGKAVLGARHQKLGELTDLLVDLSGRKPLVAVVCSRKVFHQELCCAVPFSLFGSAGKELVLETNRQHLEAAPWFTEHDWKANSTLRTPRIYRVAGSTPR